MEAELFATFPAVPYYSPGYPTTDGFIPWRLFLLYYYQIPRVSAQRTLEMASAICIALAGSDPGIQVAVRRLRRLAGEP
jgi:hypothetical protein